MHVWATSFEFKFIHEGGPTYSKCRNGRSEIPEIAMSKYQYIDRQTDMIRLNPTNEFVVDTIKVKRVGAKRPRFGTDEIFLLFYLIES